MTRSQGFGFALFCLLIGCADADDHDACSDGASCGDDEPIEELALLPPPPAFFVNVNTAVNPAAGGSVLASSNSYRARCSAAGCTVLSGAQVQLGATAATGYRFVRWTGCSNSTSPTISIAPRASTTCTATFARTHFTVTALGAGVLGTVSASVGAATCPNATCSVDLGGSVTLLATPSLGASFVGWSGCSGVASGMVLNVNNVTSNLSCTANFQRVF